MRTASGLLFLVGVFLYGGETSSVWDGVYTPEQASRGKAIFDDQCSGCHGAALTGKNGPALKGESFKSNWNGLMVDDVFEYINKSMPRGQVARLSREQTASVVAFLMMSNEFPAGKKELPSDAALLQTIRFEAAKPTLESSKPK